MLNNFSFINKLTQSAQNLFKPQTPGPTTTQQQVTLGGMKPIQGYNYTPYQVKQGDTFDSIAQANGFNITDLQQANNGMLVPPPKGSYLNLPPTAANASAMSPAATQQPTIGVSSTMSTKPLGYGAPVGYGPMYQPRPMTNMAPPGLGANSFTGAAGQANILQLVPQITQQLSSGAFPPIPFQAQQKLINPETGQPLTDQELIRMGYVYENQTQTWKNAATTAAAGAVANAPKPAVDQNALMNSLRWDPNSKKYVKVGELLRKGRLDLKGNTIMDKKKDKSGPVTVATNAGGTPSQTTNNNTGGG